ncbi:DUF4437 domain-containing protein [Sporosarcina sp. E16_3]|uniref:DUF4437 domain-containing protein n=1 Tax=Sporosarcina sp. E16_3 TaxID=2789293 RepID=UPI001A92AB62|nr:DUF4437 domain-containing protein [Sporosarcina sp. E16_3]MBO0603002.1 DUF4437 domain-containing protein [Sporosarcina sp. E16_3]
MSREHIEFINTHEMSWHEFELPGFSKEMKQKLLSYDTESGASTSIIYFPPGTTNDGGRYSVAIEAMLLTGDLKIAGNKYSDLTHFFIDSGEELRSLTSQNGCELLFMTEGKVELVDKNMNGNDKGIQINNTYELPWQGTITPGFPTGAMRKSLYQNAETGASSWLLGVLPQFKDSRYEIHPVIEEGFQIQGELDTSGGPFKAGSYFWRPSEIPHGDFNTARGCLTFFRTDGPLKTTYVEKEELPIE